MAGPDFSSRGKPVNQGTPDFSSRGRPAGQKPNYVIPKRVKVAGVDVNLTDANDAQRLATQGFAFGQAPRVMGAFGAVMGVPDAIRQGRLDPIAEAYKQNRQAEIAAIDQARQRSGLTGTAIEVAGGLVTGGTIAKTGGQALSRVAPRATNAVRNTLVKRSGSTGAKVARATGRTAVAAGGGAVAGGVYGSGEGRAAENALYGAAGGAVAAPVAAAAGGVVRGARRMVGKPAIKPEVKAARTLIDRIDPKRAQAQIDEANRLGLDPLALIDVANNSGRRLVRGVAGSTTDDAQQMAVDYAASTREALPDRGLGIVRRLTGGDVNFPARQEAAQANIRAVDNANYPQIMSERLQVTPEMLQALRPADAQAAISSARRVAELSGRQDDVAALDTVLNILRTGDVSKMDGIEVSASSLEQIYRGLRDATGGLYSDPATRSIGQAMGGVRDAFDQTLQAQSPAIRQARAASREARQGAEGLDVGYNAFAPSRLPDALAVDVAGLPQSARPNVLAGAQAQLQQQIGQNPFAAVNSIGFRPNMGARLNAMGAPADDMVAAAQMEARRVRNADFISPNTGSQTQLRATDIPDMGAVPTTLMGWATKLMDFAFRRINAFTDAELEAIVRMGIEPADLQALQALAAREPDKIPSVVKGLIGSQAGIGTAGQVNAGTSQGYQR
jgi:hypothetical protein